MSRCLCEGFYACPVPLASAHLFSRCFLKIGGGLTGLFSDAYEYHQRLKKAEKDWERAKEMLEGARLQRERCEASHNDQQGA